MRTFLWMAVMMLAARGVSAAGSNPNEAFAPGTFVTVDVNNRLERFSLAAPGVRLGSVTITGLAGGEIVLGVDFRPATGQLYALGSTSRIYRLDVLTGAASPVGAGFTPALTGTDFGFDFNPTVDRIRVVSDAEQNLRLNPDTGLTASVDTAINPAGNLVGSAYSNNFAGATTTTLYALDSSTDQLLIQNPPNNGTVTPVGPLGVDFTGAAGFDIAPNGTAYATLTAPAALTSDLYSINLTTGAATLVGTIGSSAIVRAFAVVAGPETIFGLSTNNELVRFNSNTPGTLIASHAVTGLQPGENLLGIDFRPATGELFGLGSTSRIYRVDAETGAASAVGPGPFTPLLSGTDFGFDFNPTVDRIRIVSDAEQNLRARADTGVIVAVDAPLAPAGNVVGAAYSNNVAGTLATTLYDIDSGSDLLLTQNPPNNGTLNVVGPLGVDATGQLGFDISPAGTAYASITLPGAVTSGLYKIDLATGGATLVGTIGATTTIRDIAVRIVTESAYAITQQAGPAHQLLRFNPAAPGIIASSAAITGLQGGEGILGADFRPATGKLYALGSTSRLYTIDLASGAATQVGAGPFVPALTGTSFGVDFNPVADRLRVVSDAEQNLRINADALSVTVDTTLNPAGNVVAAGYTNSFAGATTTTLYDIDSVSDMLMMQNPPNNGTLVAVGPLGVDIGPAASFDIGPVSGNAYLAAYPPAAASPTLYKVNLATGAASAIGVVNTADPLVGFAIQIVREDDIFRDGFE